MWGDYHEYVPEWWEHFAGLTRKPDEIVLVTDRKRTDIPCQQIVNPPITGTYQEASWWTVGVNALSTTWRGTLGVDDRFFQNAYEGLPSSEIADCWVVGFMEQPDVRIYVPDAFTGAELLAMPENPLGHASPFTADIWQKIGSAYPDVAWSDWTVYREIAKEGGRFHGSGKAAFYSNRHHGSLSHQYAVRAGDHRKEARNYER